MFETWYTTAAMRLPSCILIILVSTNTMLDSGDTCDRTYQEIPQIISNEVAVLKNTQTVSHNLTKAVNDIGKIKDNKVADDIFCQTCDLVLTQVLEYRRGGAVKDSMVVFFQKLCRVFTDWGPEACDGYVAIEIDIALYIIDNKKDLTAARICGIQFRSKNCKDPNENKWVVHLPGHIRHTVNDNQHHVKDASLKILHLTDFHYDPLYTPGNNAVCDLPLCCQKSNGPSSKEENAAGFWGDYHVCDMPWYSITNFTAYLKNTQEKYDFVYYTGDIISHRSWATNRQDNTKVIMQFFQHFNETFESTPVYAILGNHESHPSDSFSPNDVSPSISTQWLFDLAASEWRRWLPSGTNTTIQTGGYYTVLVKPKFRIIALNSNVCSINNLWLIYDDEDPYGQLKWLVDVLTQAEKNGEFVHILSHVPPGDLHCFQRWSNQFGKIVNRFAPIIAAQFVGHTHLDELRLFRDDNTKKINNVAFNAGSFTTYVGSNPNYRTYDIDQNTFRVLDYDQYTFNLTEANLYKDKSPEWYKLYSFKDAYGLKNTTYESFNDLVVRMSENKTLLQMYWKFQGRESAPRLAQGCNDNCLQKLLCTITAVETDQAFECQQ